MSWLLVKLEEFKKCIFYNKERIAATHLMNSIPKCGDILVGLNFMRHVGGADKIEFINIWLARKMSIEI